MRVGFGRPRTGGVGVALAAALVVMLLGATVLLRENLQRQEQRFKADLRLELFLRDDTTPLELQALTDDIKSLVGYESFSYRDKSEAYAEMQTTLGRQLLPTGGHNPFPNSVIVIFAPQSSNYRSYQNAESKFKAIRCVEGVRYPKSSMISQENVYAFFSKAAAALLLLTAVALLLLMLLAVRKTALARCEETRVLKLLGAGWKRIGLPLVIKGLTVGLSSGIAGLLLLYLLWRLSARLPLQLSFITDNGIATIIGCCLIVGLTSGLVTARSQLR
jgi:cell division protein FtsX